MPNDPRECLDAWTAQEVLSPPVFKGEADLAAKYNGKLLMFDNSSLPWEQQLPPPPKNQQYYYHVILATISHEAAIHALIEKYGDKSPERPSLTGAVILGSLLLDAHGKLLPKQGVAVSSFGWGFPIALNGSLRQLKDWIDAEQHIVDEVSKQLLRTGDDGNTLPIDLGGLYRAKDSLLLQIGIPPEFDTTKWFALRCTTWQNAAPEPLLLNSFFIGDLASARRLFAEGKAPMNLKRYLGVVPPEGRQNLLDDASALEGILSPVRFPLARWPGPGRKPLVLLQQAAVNAAFQITPEQGILAVNGPPGTGKTTLLRDLVAGIVAQRAEALCTFDIPNDAFKDSGEQLSYGGATYTRLYQLDQRIKGYEMLIASSNNKAVENVSAELPAIGAIASDADTLRYFSTLSAAVLGRDSWGIIAAVLGNSSNKYKFSQTFWWDEDYGLSTYLAEAAGTPRWFDEKDPVSGQIIGRRKPRIITNEKPPESQEDAIDRWKSAKARFLQALKDSHEQLASLESVRTILRQKAVLEETFTAVEQALLIAKSEYVASKTAADSALEILTRLGAETGQAGQECLSIGSSRPGFWARLFRTVGAKAWKMKYQEVNERYFLARQRQSAQKQVVKELQRELSRAESGVQRAQEQLRAKGADLQQLKQTLESRSKILTGTWLDRSFFRKGHEARHLSVPWCDKAIHRLRDAVFISALEVHKAFIDASAKRLKHNLGALFYVLSKGALPDDRKMALLPDLWSSLFLVVPAISTTFASVERFLGKLSAASLGWLLVDEAGQALPQAAVGALLRTQRAVVVGDPLQIEPIVVLPELLTTAISQNFDVDPLRFNAPKASAQTVADTATSYYAEFEGLNGARAVGVPLLVHRRCGEPMFGISNAIAYSRQMVFATPDRVSPIQKCLGPSLWIDVQGTAEEKWCPEEGEVVLDLLTRLKKEGIAPDLYIVTPFTIVADRLRRLVWQSGIMEEWVKEPDVWPKERIGTVHTVQGREAEAVIFVLGAPAIDQGPSRGWAGRTPNILNVAVTRAKASIYVVGNRHLWQSAGVFQQLAGRIGVENISS